MITITVHEKSNTVEDLCLLLEHIEEQLRNGFTSGIQPTWNLEGEEEPEPEEDEEDAAEAP